MALAAPTYFGLKQELFGFHYDAEGSRPRSTAVLICPPLGKEYMCSYRALRSLGERLSAAGFSALSVEYYGTGNSAGSVDDDLLVSQWLRSVTAAIEELKSRSGCEKVALVGLRMGGTLATFAALERSDIAGIVLWEPCANGGKFARQLRIIALSSPTREMCSPELGLDVAGFRFSAATLEALGELDVGSLDRPLQLPMLLLSRDDRPADERLALHLRSLGAQVAEAAFAGFAKLMAPVHESEVPDGALASIVAWHSRVFANQQPAEQARSLAPPRNGLVVASTTRAVDGSTQEVAARFRSGLFCVLTTPIAPQAKMPAVILLNTGGDHHVGPHRLYVSLARAWAEQGFAVLRADIAGLGASPARGGRDNDPFPACVLEDVRAMLQYLEQLGWERVVLVGLCSGGYHAVLASSQKLPVAGVVAINPWLHYRPPQQTLDPLLSEIEFEEVARNLLSWKKWQKFLKGKIRYRHVLLAVLNRLRLELSTLLPSLPIAVKALNRDQTRAAFLAKISPPAGVRMHLVYSRGDESLSYFTAAVGDESDDLARRLGFSAEILEDCDHEFTSSRMQALYVRVLTEAIGEYVPSRGLPAIRAYRSMSTRYDSGS